ncbi:MAG: hypothetical protein CVT59_04190 [Actinobacteria bacterium HGW-Actinobacteria-1]|jgi:hypothetical protein|nr:MAG: hypothetical protein CVT59_04190 [Actinobacteria bacterium HGW-Actinobacteria-1]
MLTERELVLSARQLEASIQEHAFELLRSQGSYDRAQGLIVVASDVNRIASRLDELLQQVATTTIPRVPSSEPKRRANGRKSTLAKYPRFFVSGDRVVKIGKGKQKSAKEYRHEATKSSFDQLARWIESQSVEGRREWLAKDADLELGEHVPAYQTYLLIAALSSAGVLRQVKRGTYSLGPNDGGPKDWWDALGSLPAFETEA